MDNGFDNWTEVLDYVREHGAIRYHAPLDYRSVRVSATVQEDKVRVAAPSRDCDPFTADEGHLDRFRRL